MQNYPINNQFNLGGLFYSVVEHNHDKIALRYYHNSFTYRDINETSNQIANYLLLKDIQPNDVIAIFNAKTYIGFSTMIACIKIGAIYTNLDYENPISRLEKIINLCSPKLIISDFKVSNDFKKFILSKGTNFTDLSNKENFLHLDSNDLEITKTITGSNIVYIMFTSGTTGVPKGVSISNDNLISFLKWSINEYKIEQKDIFAQLSPLYFDNSVFDFYTAFFSGASLVPIDQKDLQNPALLIKKLDFFKCTIWFSVPSLLIYLITLKTLSRNVLQSIRLFIFGGEGFPKKQLKKLYELYNKTAQLINVYGPTEGTCICSSFSIKKENFNDMKTLSSIGKINPNFSYIIVDSHNDLITNGKKGELCIIGPNLSIGYFNDYEKTNLVFIQNPFKKNFKEIIYKTGDLVYEKNEYLFFLGRVDNQVKHMGFRIELEEIEIGLNNLNYVDEASVIYNRSREHFGVILGFVKLNKEKKEEEIKNDLSIYLPKYMIPSKINQIIHMPKNQNGKIDKKKLIELHGFIK